MQKIELFTTELKNINLPMSISSFFQVLLILLLINDMFHIFEISLGCLLLIEISISGNKYFDADCCVIIFQSFHNKISMPL